MSDTEFFVDISRKHGSRFAIANLLFGCYEWELREGELRDARAIDHYLEVKTSGTSWTIKGAELAAARTKRKVLRERERARGFISRKPVS